MRVWGNEGGREEDEGIMREGRNAVVKNKNEELERMEEREQLKRNKK